ARAVHDADGAVLDAGRHRDLDRVLARDEAAALARGARVRDDRAAPLAPLAMTLDRDRQDALLEPDATAAVARAADVGLAPWSRTRAAAVGAGDDALVAQGLRRPERGLLEGDLELALDVAAVASTDAEHAEQVPQDPVHGDLTEVDDPALEGAAARE